MFELIKWINYTYPYEPFISGSRGQRQRHSPRFKAVENSALALKENTLVLQRNLTARHNSQPLEPENSSQLTVNKKTGTSVATTMNWILTPWRSLKEDPRPHRRDGSLADPDFCYRRPWAENPSVLCQTLDPTKPKEENPFVFNNKFVVIYLGSNSK